MSLTTLLLQAAPPTTAWSMLAGATIPTKIVLMVLTVGSVFSWWLIFAKSRQFREVRQQGDEFLDHMERAQRLEDAYKVILSLPDSPYGRVFRQGVNFFSELRPGAPVRVLSPPRAYPSRNSKRSDSCWRRKKRRNATNWPTVSDGSRSSGQSRRSWVSWGP